MAATPLFAADPKATRTRLCADEALARLKEGNDKFITDSPLRAAQGRERRIEIARGQAPFVVLVGCSDSRVPPELLFGRGLGELFIVHNAGNTVDTTALGSIEYAVAELGVRSCWCWATNAAARSTPAASGRWSSRLIVPIVPAVLKANGSTQGKPSADALLDAAMRENVRRVVNRLPSSEPSLIEAQRAGKLKIVGARYDLNDGDVEFFAD